MKKQLTYLSAIGLMVLLSNCTKNETTPDLPTNVDPDQVTFRTSVGITRSNDNALTALQGGFNVIGLDAASAYIPGFADPTDAQNVEYSFNVTTANAWDWAYAAGKSAKVWPATDVSYPLTFFAAYPKTKAVTKDATTLTAMVKSNMTDAAFIYNTYYDAAPVAFDATQVSVDELGAVTIVNTKPASGFSDLKFKHIMSKMAFRFSVPTGLKAYIQSVKIANVNKSGRQYNYTTGLWGAEPAYGAANHSHFAHYSGDPQEITSANAVVTGLADATVGFNTLKLMPQKTVAKWALGNETTPDAETFRYDVANWKASLAGGVIDAAAITKWHTSGVSAQGMKDSKGWAGARIEVIYLLVDETNPGNPVAVVGKKGAARADDRYVRVGYELDLTTIVGGMGWEAGKSYTFDIPLGTASASNGILLDPDYKTYQGQTTSEPVSTPKTAPGEPITKNGIIQFNVTVDDWGAAVNVPVN